MVTMTFICLLIKWNTILFIVLLDIEVMTQECFVKGPLDGGFTLDSYLLEIPADHWHIQFRKKPFYKAPGAALNRNLNYNGAPTFYTRDFPELPRDKWLKVIEQINTYAQDSLLHLNPGQIHVLLPWQSMNRELFDYQHVQDLWNMTIKKADSQVKKQTPFYKRWYTTSNIVQRAEMFSEHFPPESHIVAFNKVR